MSNKSNINTGKKTSLRMSAVALALAGVTAVSLPASAYAGGWHGRHHDRGWRGHNDGAGVAIAAGVGLLLGAALMSSAQQPAYYEPRPAPAYAPPPPYYGQGQAYYGPGPLQASPASDIYRSASGEYCREYQSTARIGGRLQSSYGTACQGPDGAWRIVN